MTDSCGNSLKFEIAACIAVHRLAAINSAAHISPTNLFGSLFRLEYINMVNLQINLRLSSRRPRAPSRPETGNLSVALRALHFRTPSRQISRRLDAPSEMEIPEPYKRCHYLLHLRLKLAIGLINYSHVDLMLLALLRPGFYSPLGA